MNFNFLDENARGGGLRPNLWVAYNRNSSANPIVVMKTDQLMMLKCSTHYVAFIHAANNYLERRKLWLDLLQFTQYKVCLMGDFIAIIGSHEQRGHRSVSRISCEEFRDFIAGSSLIDLESSGPFYTWRSSHSGPVVVSRLDRVLVSDLFVDIWVSVTSSVLPRAVSDHHPLLLSCSEVAS